MNNIENSHPAIDEYVSELISEFDDRRLKGGGNATKLGMQMGLDWQSRFLKDLLELESSTDDLSLQLIKDQLTSYAQFWSGVGFVVGGAAMAADDLIEYD